MQHTCALPAAAEAGQQGQGIEIRRGLPSDSWHIRVTAFQEKLNPLGIGDPSRFLVATTPGAGEAEGGSILGFGQLEQKAVVAGCQQWELRSVVVDRAHRGKGVGSAVVRALLARVPVGDEVLLITLKKRQPFYLRLGFEAVSGPPPSWLALEAALGTVVSRLAGHPDGLAVMAWKRSAA